MGWLAQRSAPCYNTYMPHRIYFGDNLPILQSLPSESVDLIYIDPPFNTGKTQARTQIRAERSEQGDRVGFTGARYQTIKLGSTEKEDVFDDFLVFLEPRLLEAKRLLKPHGALYFHIDYREVHYCKLLLDQIFGRDHFINEIIWAYDYGGKPKTRWPAKHDNILFYVKDPAHYVFNVDAIEREPYMAPGLVGRRRPRGASCPSTYGGIPLCHHRLQEDQYPTQKPLGVINRILTASLQPRRPGPGFLRRQRHSGGELPQVGQAFHPAG